MYSDYGVKMPIFAILNSEGLVVNRIKAPNQKTADAVAGKQAGCTAVAGADKPVGYSSSDNYAERQYYGEAISRERMLEYLDSEGKLGALNDVINSLPIREKNRLQTKQRFRVTDTEFQALAAELNLSAEELIIETHRNQ